MQLPEPSDSRNRRFSDSTPETRYPARTHTSSDAGLSKHIWIQNDNLFSFQNVSMLYSNTQIRIRAGITSRISRITIRGDKLIPLGIKPTCSISNLYTLGYNISVVFSENAGGTFLGTKPSINRLNQIQHDSKLVVTYTHNCKLTNQHEYVT